MVIQMPRREKDDDGNWIVIEPERPPIEPEVLRQWEIESCETMLTTRSDGTPWYTDEAVEFAKQRLKELLFHTDSGAPSRLPADLTES